MRRRVKKTMALLMTFAMLLTLLPAVPLSASAAAPVTYLDAKGKLQTVTDYTTLTTGRYDSLDGGWYVVKEDITISGNPLCIREDVHLVLCDGATMSFDAAGCVEIASGSLNIYGQSTDEKHAGRLEIEGVKQNHAPITVSAFVSEHPNLQINGGVVSLRNTQKPLFAGEINPAISRGFVEVNGGWLYTYGYHDTSIQGGVGMAEVSLRINGGSVEAWGDVGGSGIVDADVILMNGGQLLAYGGEGGMGIQGDYLLMNGGLMVAYSEPGYPAIQLNGIYCLGGMIYGISSDDPKADAPTAEGVAAESFHHTGGLIFSNKVAKLYGKTVTLKQDYTIAGSDILIVEKGKTLSLQEGVTLRVNGVLVREGTITGKGTVQCGHGRSSEICWLCGALLDGPKQVNGVYQLTSQDDLFWLAQMVNEGKLSKFDAVLTNDITIDRVWEPINLPDGADNASTFDGGGHSITFKQTQTDSSTENFGLFSSFNYSEVKDLVLKGSMTVNSSGNVGALAGSAYRTEISNVISYVNVTNQCTTGGATGGLVGHYGGKHDDPMFSKIENCAVYGNVTGFYAGGLVGRGWNGTQYYDITNAAYVGNVTAHNGGAAGAIVGYQSTDSNTSRFTNIYWNENDGLPFYGARDTEAQVYTQTEAKTLDQFSSGEVAWLLNGSQTNGPWKQNLGADAYPTFTGGTVYSGPSSCAADGVVTYSNSPVATPAHTDSNGDETCDVCGDLLGEDVTIGGEGGTDCPAALFTDVDTFKWYHEGLDFVLDNGLMNGVSDTRFDPNGTTNRAMIVTILWRLTGEPEAQNGGFSDVQDGKWYSEAVCWAAENEIVTGYGDGTFGPKDAITREQMAAILYRYAQYFGADVSLGEDTNILSYEDAASVSEYAVSALQWACGEGIINGMSGKLVPEGDATRAQAATVLMRFCACLAG